MNSTSISGSEVYKSLCSIAGSSNVSESRTVNITYGFDSSAAPAAEPAFVVLARSVEQIKHILEHANRHGIPITTVATGQNVAGTALPRQGGIVLDLQYMNNILEINTDAGYALVEPGVTYNQLSAAITKQGFRCHIPTSPGGSSVLANHLLAPSGSLNTRHLDSVIALEVVLPNGEIVKTGSAAFPGSRFFLRYGPFPDLTGLFCYSYGTLGVVTKASIRIYPISEDTRVPAAAFDNFSSSVQFVKEVVIPRSAEESLCPMANAEKTQRFQWSLPRGPATGRTSE